MLIFALNMSGVFEFGLLGHGRRRGTPDARSGLRRLVFHRHARDGCRHALHRRRSSHPPSVPRWRFRAFQAFAVFTAIAIGLSTPYLLLSIFPVR